MTIVGSRKKFAAQATFLGLAERDVDMVNRKNPKTINSDHVSWFDRNCEAENGSTRSFFKICLPGL
jgi:hypothetical protein